jgi:hypothetical protein
LNALRDRLQASPMTMLDVIDWLLQHPKTSLYSEDPVQHMGRLELMLTVGSSAWRVQKEDGRHRLVRRVSASAQDQAETVMSVDERCEALEEGME